MIFGDETLMKIVEIFNCLLFIFKDFFFNKLK